VKIMAEKQIKIAKIKVDVFFRMGEIEKLVESAIRRPWPNDAIKISKIHRSDLVDQEKKLKKALRKLSRLKSDLYRCE
jgi:predicted RNA binding protein with dsRBD fold (UPF0201 family)